MDELAETPLERLLAFFFFAFGTIPIGLVLIVTLSRGGDVRGVSASRAGARRNVREVYDERAS